MYLCKVYILFALISSKLFNLVLEIDKYISAQIKHDITFETMNEERGTTKINKKFSLSNRS